MKCKKHPSYLAIRKPTANCDRCRLMWTQAKLTDIVKTSSRTISEMQTILNALHDFDCKAQKA